MEVVFGTDVVAPEELVVLLPECETLVDELMRVEVTVVPVAAVVLFQC